MLAFLLPCLLAFGACSSDVTSEDKGEKTSEPNYTALVTQYAPFTLTADLSGLSEKEKQMIPLLIKASEIMDQLFWVQAYGNKDSLLQTVEDEDAKTYVLYNYGPWDRLNADEPFLPGVGPKPAGANFYPADMTKKEFEAAPLEDKESLYTFIRRDETGALQTVWYHDQFKEE